MAVTERLVCMAITTRRVDLEIYVYATLWLLKITFLVISVSTAGGTAGEMGGQVGNLKRGNLLCRFLICMNIKFNHEY